MVRWHVGLYIGTRLIAKAIRILRAKFHCSRLTVQDIQNYASLIFETLCSLYFCALSAAMIASPALIKHLGCVIPAVDFNFQIYILSSTVFPQPAVLRFRRYIKADNKTCEA